MMNKKNGNELESKFNDWLQSCRNTINPGPELAGKHNIIWHVWLSSEQKEAPFDFWATCAPNINTIIYCDVVGWAEVSSGILLNTKSKDWNRLLEYCKQHTEELRKKGLPFTDFKAYIVYSPTHGYLEGDWEFMKISSSLPTGGVFISKDRKRGLRTAQSVFGDTQEWVFDKEEHFSDLSGESFTLSAMIRTKEHSKLVHELAAHIKTVCMKDEIENRIIS